jgi:putative DNA primase/helicase
MIDPIKTAKDKLPLPDLIRKLGDELRPEPKNCDEFTIFSPLRDDGNNPSFAITRKADGFVYYDHGTKKGGDEITYIMQKLGLSNKDAIKHYLELAGVDQATFQKPKREIVKTYDYTDEKGKLLHQTVRFSPKGFMQRRPDPKGSPDLEGGCWTWSIKGTRVVLYNLPALMDLKRKDETIFIVEGEKDADTLNSLGMLTTTSPMGSGTWPDHFNVWLHDRDVIIIPDQDEAGQEHQEKLTKSLTPSVRSLGVIHLKEVWPECPTKGDITDAVESGVCDAETLDKWAEGAHMGQASLDDASDLLNDIWNAKRLAQRLKNCARYVHQFGTWRYWDDRRWREDEDGWITRQSMISAKSIWGDVATAPSDKRRDEVITWARISGHENRLKSAVNLAASFDGIASTVGQFDSDSWKLNCRNGVVDLKTGHVQGHQPSEMHTKMAEAELVNGSVCPHWEKFLQVVFDGNEELIKFFKRCCGYSLTGAVTEQVLFFLYGCGRNGKSTALELLAAILADYAQRAPATLMVHDARGSAIPTDMARLQGARFVAASEVESGARLAEAKIKDLTGGDTITARFMRQDYFQFSPTHKLWIAGNHKPAVSGDDLGIWRRIIMIPFTVIIPEEDIDPNLPEKLLAERDGILEWMVKGCLAWQSEGLNPPKIIKAALAEYREEEDVLGEFLSECCVEGEGKGIERSQLYKAYQLWADSEGMERRYQLTNKSFTKKLRERGFTARKSHGRRILEGLTEK